MFCVMVILTTGGSEEDDDPLLVPPVEVVAVVEEEEEEGMVDGLVLPEWGPTPIPPELDDEEDVVAPSP